MRSFSSIASSPEHSNSAKFPSIDRLALFETYPVDSSFFSSSSSHSARSVPRSYFDQSRIYSVGTRGGSGPGSQRDANRRSIKQREVKEPENPSPPSSSHSAVLFPPSDPLSRSPDLSLYRHSLNSSLSSGLARYSSAIKQMSILKEIKSELDQQSKKRDALRGQLNMSRSAIEREAASLLWETAALSRSTASGADHTADPFDISLVLSKQREIHDLSVSLLSSQRESIEWERKIAQEKTANEQAIKEKKCRLEATQIACRANKDVQDAQFSVDLIGLSAIEQRFPSVFSSDYGSEFQLFQRVKYWIQWHLQENERLRQELQRMAAAAAAAGIGIGTGGTQEEPPVNHPPEPLEALNEEINRWIARFERAELLRGGLESRSRWYSAHRLSFVRSARLCSHLDRSVQLDFLCRRCCLPVQSPMILSCCGRSICFKCLVKPDLQGIRSKLQDSLSDHDHTAEIVKSAVEAGIRRLEQGDDLALDPAPIPCLCPLCGPRVKSHRFSSPSAFACLLSSLGLGISLAVPDLPLRRLLSSHHAHSPDHQHNRSPRSVESFSALISHWLDEFSPSFQPRAVALMEQLEEEKSRIQRQIEELEVQKSEKREKLARIKGKEDKINIQARSRAIGTAPLAGARTK